jgi:hypothetical protein
MLDDRPLHSSLLAGSLPVPVAFNGAVWVASATPTGMLYFINDDGTGSIKVSGETVPAIVENTLDVEYEFAPVAVGYFDYAGVVDTDTPGVTGPLVMSMVCVDITTTFNTVYVRKNGQPTGTGTVDDPVDTLQAGIDLMSSNGVLNVGAGYFEETSLDVSSLSGISIVAGNGSSFNIGALTQRSSANYMFKGGVWDIHSVVSV